MKTVRLASQLAKTLKEVNVETWKFDLEEVLSDGFCMHTLQYAAALRPSEQRIKN